MLCISYRKRRKQLENALQGLFFLGCCETSGIFKQNVLSLKNLPNLVFNCHKLIFQVVHTIQFMDGLSDKSLCLSIYIV